MKKLNLLLLLLVLLLPVTPVFAHTGLHESVPSQGETLTEPIKELVLTFETKIESGSTMELKTSAGELVKPDEVIINNNVLTGKFQPLKNDHYQVIWKVIGSDGHPIDGEYSFTVNASVSVDESEQTAPNNQNEANEGTNEELLKDNAEENDNNEAIDNNNGALPVEKSNETENDGLSPFMIGAGIVVVIVIFVLLRRMMKRG